MKFEPKTPPRQFSCGKDGWVTLSDTGTVALQDGERLDFPAGPLSYRLCSFKWGYLIENPLNSVEKSDNWLNIIAGAASDKMHLMLVSPSLRNVFDDYCGREGLTVFAVLNATSNNIQANDTPSPSVQIDPDLEELVLGQDEQITMVSENGSEVDVARKEWGFYATPSIGSRLPRYGYNACLIRNADDALFMAVVLKQYESEFDAFLLHTGQKFVAWCDDKGQFLNNTDSRVN
jgi:hypothetical protein